MTREVGGKLREQVAGAERAQRANPKGGWERGARFGRGALGRRRPGVIFCVGGRHAHLSVVCLTNRAFFQLEPEVASAWSLCSCVVCSFVSASTESMFSSPSSSDPLSETRRRGEDLEAETLRELAADALSSSVERSDPSPLGTRWPAVVCVVSLASASRLQPAAACDRPASSSERSASASLNSLRTTAPMRLSMEAIISAFSTSIVGTTAAVSAATIAACAAC